jgi:tetratricopeptide (TPR) repeat protein
MSLAQNGIQHEPHSTDAMIAMGDELFAQSQDSVGEEYMLRAAAARPEQLKAWTTTARHYLETGNVQKAARFVDTLAVRGRSSAEAQALIARYYYEMGRCDLAVETFRHSLNLDYPTVGTLFDYGMALICVGDNRAAVEAYETLLSLAPSLREALNAYRTAVQQAPDFTQAWESLAKASLKAGDLRGARAAAEEYFQLNPPADRAQRLRELLNSQ